MVLTSAHRDSFTAHGQYSGRSRDQKKKAAKRATVTTGNGFLNHAFLPVTVNAHPELKKRDKVEREFFTSLDHLAGLYGFELVSSFETAYPYNLHLFFIEAEKQIKRINPRVELRVIQDEEHTATLVTVNTMSTGQQLYYIPLKPLWLLSKDKQNRPVFKLLLSLFANLYRRGVPSYRDNDSFLSGTYEMLSEWIRNDPSDWDDNYYADVIADLNQQAHYGDRLFRQICHEYTASQFEQRVKKFTGMSEIEEEIAAVSREFSELFRQFPDASFFDHMRHGLYEWEDENVMYPEHYLSFFWTEADSIYESLMENVNVTLNECSRIVEPLTIQFFDEPQEQERQDCYFEWRFLLLTDYLCDILYRI
jgi:hypothetical protein